MGVWPERDWTKTIETHRQALLAVLAGLVTLANCLGGGPTLPRHLQRAVMRLLRPAESAARRLVILAALRLPMPAIALPPWRPRKRKPKPKSVFLRKPGGTGILLPRGFVWPKDATSATPSPLWGGIKGGGSDASLGAVGGGAKPSRPPAFHLLDPMRRIQLRRYPVRNSVPRILFPGYAEPFRIVRPRPDDAVDATSLTRRFAALTGALADIQAQARRFLRWQAQNARARAAGYRRRLGALRGGPPPGQTRRRTHEVHDILDKLHAMAWYAIAYPDTS